MGARSWCNLVILMDIVLSGVCPPENEKGREISWEQYEEVIGTIRRTYNVKVGSPGVPPVIIHVWRLEV